MNRKGEKVEEGRRKKEGRKNEIRIVFLYR
jgi:hypothetical protein